MTHSKRNGKSYITISCLPSEECQNATTETKIKKSISKISMPPNKY